MHSINQRAGRARSRSGFQMIRSIDIKNFRCFQRLEVKDCGRLNVVVGDNGTGKTALLEGIFLPLCVSAQIPLRMRTQRGLDATFNAAPRQIEDAIWGDFFYHHNFRQPIQITLDGDGADNRSLVISRTPPGTFLPLSDANLGQPISYSPLTLVWKDAQGVERPITPTITAKGMEFPETGEDMPDFFMFASNQTITAIENAGRYSELSRRGAQKKFVDLMTQEYPWISDIAIEIVAGSPALFGTVKATGMKLPIANVSGGINRIVGILLAIAHRERSVVLVDEIENGIYFKHQTSIWRGLLSFVREFKSQLFATTHSEEMLEALLDAAGDDVSDIRLWRMERGAQGPVLRQFGGSTFKAGIEAGGEMR